MESHHYHQQQLKQRIQRHQRLMKMIQGYQRSNEEQVKLEKIKNNTMMEINIRYLRSEHNRHYRFPLEKDQEQEQDQEQGYDPALSKKQAVIYDLNSQNSSLKPSRSISKKTLSLESSRRVVSLEIERDHWQRDKLLRLDFKAKNKNTSTSSKNLTRKNSFSQKIKANGSRLRLPELRIEKYRQNLKTESRVPEEEPQIQSVISKKLITESCEGRKKMQGVEKYLQKMDPKGLRTKVHRFQMN